MCKFSLIKGEEEWVYMQLARLIRAIVTLTLSLKTDLAMEVCITESKQLSNASKLVFNFKDRRSLVRKIFALGYSLFVCIYY